MKVNPPGVAVLTADALRMLEACRSPMPLDEEQEIRAATAAMLENVAARVRPDRGPRDVVERVLVLIMCSGFFPSEGDVIEQVLRVARMAPAGDADCDKIRCWARSASDGVNPARVALDVIKEIARARIKRADT